MKHEEQTPYDLVQHIRDLHSRGFRVLSVKLTRRELYELVRQQSNLVRFEAHDDIRFINIPVRLAP